MAPLVARQAKPGGLPVIVVDTAKGAIEVQLFQVEAPKSVEHILALVRRDFYRGHRIHRVTAHARAVRRSQLARHVPPGLLGQGGQRRADRRVRVVEEAPARARRGRARAFRRTRACADSQIYFMKAASPGLDGKHAVIGQVVSGMAVVDKLQETDIVKSVSIKGAGPK